MNTSSNVTPPTAKAASGLELHEDPVPPGASILIADDVLATGGTARAALRLAENLGGTVLGFAFLIEIAGLGSGSAIGSRFHHHSITRSPFGTKRATS